MKLVQCCLFTLLVLPSLVFSQLTWTQHLIEDSFWNAKGIDVIDLDGDGDLDVIGSASGADEVAWWENLGVEGFSTKQVIADSADGAEGVSAADLDGDGDIDIAASIFYANQIVWYENDGEQGFTPHVVDDYLHSATSVHTADVDADGNVDILAAGARSDSIILYRSLGFGEFEPILVADNYDTPESVKTGDMDGDGDLDIVSCAGQNLGSVSWWENQNGATEFVHHYIDYPHDGASSIDLTDMDNDGDLDIVSTAYRANDLVWYQNNSSGVFTKHFIDSDLDEVRAAVGIDAEIDGMVDVVAMSDDGIVEYHRVSEYGFEATTIGEGSGWIMNMVATDLNQDGLMDFVTSERFDDDIIWWERTERVAVEVLSPNGGEFWRPTTGHLITWNSSSPSTPVWIELLQAGSLFWVIETSTDNDGEYEWVIPANLPLRSDYQIQVRLTDFTGQDESDEAFSVVQLPDMTVTPQNMPIIIPSEGGSYSYSVMIENPASVPVSGQLWSHVILPDGTTFGPLWLEDISIDAYGVYELGDLSQWVPEFAPHGMYQHVTKAGIFPTLPSLSSSFSFVKLGESGQLYEPVDQWRIEDWQLGADTFFSIDADGSLQNSALPVEHMLLQVYPNPFNGSATVNVSLPTEVELTVGVYNTIGQRVVMLHDGTIRAGTHSLNFDATHLASGLYFVQATVRGKMNEVQKVMLIR
jgi:FG-GAP-like repeat/Secretion system C-terminal sorting domain